MFDARVERSASLAVLRPQGRPGARRSGGWVDPWRRFSSCSSSPLSHGNIAWKSASGLSNLSQDLRFCVARTPRRSPGFTGVSRTLSLAIGIGLSAATFAIVDSMLNPKIPIAGYRPTLSAPICCLAINGILPRLLEQVRALQALPGVERVGMMGFDGVPHVIIANGVQSIPQPVDHAVHAELLCDDWRHHGDGSVSE